MHVIHPDAQVLICSHSIDGPYRNNRHCTYVHTPAVFHAAVLLACRHLPIPGVTVDAVYWMYRNLHKAVKYTPAGSTTARTVPMFQLLHPVDHLSFSCSDPHVKNGSSLDWIELQMTKCRIMAGPGGLWNCSDAVTNRDRRKGFVRTDPAVQWTKKFLPTKLTSTVTQLDKSGYKGYGETLVESVLCLSSAH
jgi:hypothetical protein